MLQAGWNGEWLEKNHLTKTEIWLVCPLKKSGIGNISYSDTVEEAICFGWIDGIQKKYGENTSAQRFTPRTKKSTWSELNKHRARNLDKEGKIAAAGKAVLPDLKLQKLSIAPDILAAIKSDKITWKHFQAFPDYYVRIRVAFIEEVRKNPEVFNKRLENFIKQTRSNKRFGTIK